MGLDFRTTLYVTMHWTIQFTSYLRHITCTFRFSHSLSMAPAASQSLIIFPCNFPFINFPFLNPSHSFSYLQLLYFKHKAGLLSPFFCFVPQWASASASFFLLSFCRFYLSSGQVHESERGAPAPNCHAWHISTVYKKTCISPSIFAHLELLMHPNCFL